MAWLSGWTKRAKLTIDNTDIDETLSNFPILVYISVSSGRNNDDISCVFDELGNDDNRKKIAVTQSDEITECYVEIEKWDDANEKAWLWVKVPSIASDADTELYLYYDNSHADNTGYVGDPSDAVVHNVWDSNFKLVTHMRDDPDTSHIRDSTVNANDGTKKAANEPVVTTSGKTDDAQHFDGTDDYVDCGREGLNPLEITLEAWAKADSGVSYAGIVTNKPRAAKYGINLQMGQNQRIAALVGNGDGYLYVKTAWASSPGTWYHIIVTHSDTTNKLYVDGDLETTATYELVYSSPTTPTAIGSFYYQEGSPFLPFNGIIDEVRISDIARTASWIKASYESERDDLLDWGSEEVGFEVIDGTATGSGIGLSGATGILVKLGLATGSGVGLATSTALLDVLASASGSGVGATSFAGKVISGRYKFRPIEEWTTAVSKTDRYGKNPLEE